MRRGNAWLVVLFVVLVAQPVSSQTKEAGKSYVLKAARMFDGKSNALSSPDTVALSGQAVIAAPFASLVGQVLSSGLGSSGQLGTGRVGSSFVPVGVSGLSGVVATAGGAAYRLAGERHQQS